MRYCIAQHCGGLKECLATEKEISYEEYLKIKDEYDFYAFDNRIDAYRYLINDMKHNTNRTWLHIYIYPL